MLSGSTQLDLKTYVVVEAYKQYSRTQHVDWLIKCLSSKGQSFPNPLYRIETTVESPLVCGYRTKTASDFVRPEEVVVSPHGFQRYERQLNAGYRGPLPFLVKFDIILTLPLQESSIETPVLNDKFKSD